MGNLAEKMQPIDQDEYRTKLIKGGPEMISPDIKKKDNVIDIKPAMGERTTEREVYSQIEALDQAIASYKKKCSILDDNKRKLMALPESAVNKTIDSEKISLIKEIDDNLNELDSLIVSFGVEKLQSKKGSLKDVQSENIIAKLKEREITLKSIREQIAGDEKSEAISF